jgi:hypothetical protein
MSLRFRLIAALLLIAGCAEVGKEPDDPSDVQDNSADPQTVRVNGSIVYGQTITVAYHNPPRYHSYSFAGHRGDAIDVRVRSTDGDSMVRILDASNRVLIANDDSDGTLDSHATLTLSADGTYCVSVREYNLRAASLTVTLLGPPSCAPTTCDGEGAECGTIDDGCGGTLDCGGCTSPETCGGGGTPNVCGGSPDDPYAGLSDGPLKAKVHDVESVGYVSLGYSRARDQLYQVGGVDENGGQIECIYTGELRPATATGTAPSGFNTEHSWPQSLGASAEPMKSDLHHLYPSLETANSARANFYFGMTSCGDPGQAACDWQQAGSQLGVLTGGTVMVFEVRASRRGDLARSWFYFATRYNLAIPAFTEAILKDWSAADPPDALERRRNDRIEALQHTRNVFVDRPDLVSRISDF